MKEIAYYLVQLSNFMFFFLLFLLIAWILLKVAFHSFHPKGKSLDFYGILLGLDTNQIMAISVSLLKYLFLLWCLLTGEEVPFLYFAVLCGCSVFYFFFTKKFLMFGMDVCNNVLEYFALIALGLLFQYLKEVRFEWYVFLAAILLIIFIFLYALYFCLIQINEVAKQKTNRRKRNEKKFPS